MDWAKQQNKADCVALLEAEPARREVRTARRLATRPSHLHDHTATDSTLKGVSTTPPKTREDLTLWEADPDTAAVTRAEKGWRYGSRSDPPLPLLLTYTQTPSSLQRAAALLAAASSGDEMGLKALLDEEGVRIEWKDQVGA